jgi:adenylate kinase family enzyme
MKRVVILGRGASGKSTLAVSLGEITGLPAIKNQEAKGNEQKTPRPTLA